MGKRLCSVLLSFCLVVGLMPCLAYAEVPHEGSASGSSAAQEDVTGLAEATTTEAATSPENTTGGGGSFFHGLRIWFTYQRMETTLLAMGR